MAQQSSFYNTDGTTRTYPSSKHIASKQHVAVYFQSVTTSTWGVIEQSLYELVNNSIVFTDAPDSALYSQIEIRVADTAAELTESPSDIAIVAGAIADISSVANDITNVDTVATNIGSVNTVSANNANVTTVATNIASVVTTAGSIANVNTTASNIADINTVASDLNEPISEINTVATDIANVNTVGLNIASVKTVAGISSNVTTVAGNNANVTTVAGISGNVTTVAGISTKVTTVANNNTNVSTVAGISGNVTTVAGISGNVTAVATNNTNVTTVASNITNVNSVATNIVPNLAEILLADTNAATATTKAAEASASAASAKASELAATAIVTDPLKLAIGNINSPLLDMPLKNSLAMKAGVGSATFTRASTATYIDRYGMLKTAAIDEPRFEKEGYLNEGSSTNFILNSDNCSTGASTQWSVTTESVTTPYGTTLSVLKATSTASGQVIRFGDLVSGVAGTTYTGSIWLKSTSSTTVNMDVNNSTKSLKTLTTEFIRYSVSGSDATNPYRFFDIESTASGQVVYFFGAQLEALPFATSYIPTTASTVTRSADVLSVTRVNNMPDVQDNYNGFSLACDFNLFGVVSGGTHTRWSLYSSTVNSIYAYSNSIGTGTAVRNNVSSTFTTSSTPILRGREVSVFSNTSSKEYINGNLFSSVTNTSGKLTQTQNSTLADIGIGRRTGTTGNTTDWYGHISNFRIYDKALSSAEVALA